MIKKYKGVCLAVLCGIILGGCNGGAADTRTELFKLLSPSVTNIHFKNELKFQPEFNIYRYRNFYNGGGVALGDINNDGLIDIFFTSNLGDNVLYLNKGGMVFEDISKKAGIAGTKAWSTGVSMADVNGDGLLDIYVANSGIVKGDDRKNELYINNGDTTFTEKAAEYGIDDEGLSIHGVFFDYDKDGDLDLYVANNSYKAIGSFNLKQVDRSIESAEGGDRLYRNDGDKFTNVTEEAGIYSSEFGFALGAAVGDLNRDGWPDIYISNDFFERDYLYINNQDGTFREVLEEQINSISTSSMGADIADLNRDGYPEIFVTDMLPESESRLKVITFADWERYRMYVNNGFHHQFTRNTLQLNNGNGTFSEVGRFAGVEATDWSWAALMADFDLDGRRDIFVANGIYKDITNLDYLLKVSQKQVVRKMVQGNKVDFKRLIGMMPSTPISNYMFRNLGNMQFADSSSNWGLDTPGFSTGSAYGDLDNDGDLDLVINNIGSKASVYENRATELRPDNHWLKISFEGLSPNTFAFGAQVTAWENGKQWFAEQMPIRGFQSTMDHRLHLGLGHTQQLDSLIVYWPSGRTTKLIDVKTNRLLKLKEKNAPLKDTSLTNPKMHKQKQALLKDITDQFNIDWQHNESEFVDFERDRLLFHMRSREGPALCIGDVDGDNLDDFYVGGASGQAGSLFVQNTRGQFDKISIASFSQDASSEDTDCTFFDANGDGKEDLYVASGSNEFTSSSSSLGDRLYFNQGNFSFRRSEQALPSWSYETTSAVEAADFDQDGDQDLFVGVRLRPFSVGYPVRGYLLENDGDGKFRDVTEEICPELMRLGMTTDAEWGDMNGDGFPDLFVVGEWMPLTLFENNKGKFRKRVAKAGLDSTHGWWRSVHIDDLNGDGHLDFIAGNYGLNSRFRASKSEPVEMWTGDFNRNGTIEQVVSTYKQHKRYPMALRHKLLDEIPFLKSKFPTYQSFAGKTVNEIFSDKLLNEAHHSQAFMLNSVVGWNDGTGSFDIHSLPFQSQISVMYGITTANLNDDKFPEIIMGGNMIGVKPSIGNYMASYGTVLKMNDDKSYRSISPESSGFEVRGQIRDIERLELADGRSILIVARNNSTLKFFEIKGDG